MGFAAHYFFAEYLFLLTLADCRYRALSCTGTAVDTGICIDLVLRISLRNCRYRTLACARTAADACITDYICHDNFLLIWMFLIAEVAKQPLLK